VLLPVELSGGNPAQYIERARELLELVGLGDFSNKRPGELSGGMQQRASLCRALIMDPPILLMDEPFGALDAMTRDEMNIELLRIWGESSAAGGQRKTIVFVTHSIPEAVKIGSRILLLSPHPGQVKAELNSLPRGDAASGGEAHHLLEDKIHALLFADEVEKERVPHA
jgi:NitT/TauT family transport system ATP-binding protein